MQNTRTRNARTQVRMHAHTPQAHTHTQHTCTVLAHTHKHTHVPCTHTSTHVCASVCARVRTRSQTCNAPLRQALIGLGADGRRLARFRRRQVVTYNLLFPTCCRNQCAQLPQLLQVRVVGYFSFTDRLAETVEALIAYVTYMVMACIVMACT